jgi:hypothetical protein
VAVCEYSIASKAVRVTEAIDDLSLVVGSVHIAVVDANGEVGGRMHIQRGL